MKTCDCRVNELNKDKEDIKMESIEFTADIQDGIIKLPDEYKNLPKKAKIKVIFIPYEVQKRKLDSLFDSAVRVNKIDKFDRDSLHER
jgi:hypothetical protein